VLLAVAACLGLTVIVTALVFPIFFGARAWKKGSPDAAARMNARNAQMESQIVTYSARKDAEVGLSDLEDSIRNKTANLEEKHKGFGREMEGGDAGLVMDNRRGGIDEDFSAPSDTTTRGLASGEVARLRKSREPAAKADLVTRDYAEAGHSLQRRPVAPGKPAAPASHRARQQTKFHALAAQAPPPAAAEPPAEEDEFGSRGTVSNGRVVPLATNLPASRIEGTPESVTLSGVAGTDAKPVAPPKVTAKPKSAPAAAPTKTPAIASGIVDSKDDAAFGIGGGSGGGLAGGAKGQGQVPMLGDVPATGAMFGTGAAQLGGEADAKSKHGQDVAGIVTGGLRSGDAAVTRNSIDAILNNPGQKGTDAPTADAQGLAGRATAGGRTAERWGREGEATDPAAPADHEHSRAESLTQVDSAWALEVPEEEGRQAGQKANKKLDKAESASERGKRRLNEPAGLHFTDKEAEPLGGVAVDGEVRAGLGIKPGGGGNGSGIEELAKQVEDTRSWYGAWKDANPQSASREELGELVLRDGDEAAAPPRPAGDQFFADGLIAGADELIDRSKSMNESLGTAHEAGFQWDEGQKSAVQKLREDMAGEDGFGDVTRDEPALRFESRSLDVGPDFLHRFRLAEQKHEENGDMDPFADNSGSDHSLLRRQTAGDVLLNYGFQLPEGSEVSFDAQDGKLFIKAPEDTVAGLQQLVDSLPETSSTDEAIDLMAEMSAQEEPFSTFSLHVSDASFRVAAAALERGERPDPEAVRPEEFYNAFDYGDPAPTAGEPVACAIEQCAHPLLPSRNLVRVGVRTAAAGRGAGQPLRLTVMLDNSGSMERADRRAAVQAAMEQLASLLGPQDVVTVVGFARQPRLLCDRVSGEGVKAQLEGLVERTPAEGGTNLEQALALADELAMRQFDAGAQNRIVLLTDGAANLGNADPEELAKRVEGLRQKGVSFDAAGFGTAGMNDRMLERLTRDGNGRYYVVDGPEDADEQFAKKLAGAFRPAAENVKVQVRFNPARVGGYRLIGFEEHRLKKRAKLDDAA